MPLFLFSRIRCIASNIKAWPKPRLVYLIIVFFFLRVIVIVFQPMNAGKTIAGGSLPVTSALGANQIYRNFRAIIAKLAFWLVYLNNFHFKFIFAIWTHSFHFNSFLVLGIFLSLLEHLYYNTLFKICQEIFSENF